MVSVAVFVPPLTTSRLLSPRCLRRKPGTYQMATLLVSPLFPIDPSVWIGPVYGDQYGPAVVPVIRPHTVCRFSPQSLSVHQATWVWCIGWVFFNDLSPSYRIKLWSPSTSLFENIGDHLFFNRPVYIEVSVDGNNLSNSKVFRGNNKSRIC